MTLTNPLGKLELSLKAPPGKYVGIYLTKYGMQQCKISIKNAQSFFISIFNFREDTVAMGLVGELRKPSIFELTPASSCVIFAVLIIMLI